MTPHCDLPALPAAVCSVGICRSLAFARSSSQYKINNIDPREDASEDRPKNGAIPLPGTHHSDCRPESDPCLGHRLRRLICELRKDHRIFIELFFYNCQSLIQPEISDPPSFHLFITSLTRFTLQRLVRIFQPENCLCLLLRILDPLCQRLDCTVQSLAHRASVALQEG